MPQYKSGNDIIAKYNPLYGPVFSERHLYCIFNDEHDYDVTDAEFSDENIMLTMGHYFTLENEDLNRAKFFYNKVVMLNSAYGLYSLGVFYYTQKHYPKARLCATNGLNLNVKGSHDCAKLLHKISVATNDFHQAEKHLLNEIERLDKFDKLDNSDTSDAILKDKTIEELCFFYLNVSKDSTTLVCFGEAFLGDNMYNNVANNSFVTPTVISNKIRAILAKHYYDIHDDKNLLRHAEFMLKHKIPIGYYFMGLHSYLQFVIACKNGIIYSSINDYIEVLEISETWFDYVSMAVSLAVTDNDFDELKDNALKMINKINNIQQQFNKISLNLSESQQAITT